MANKENFATQWEIVMADVYTIFMNRWQPALK
jgi:hypothetical protein